MTLSGGIGMEHWVTKGYYVVDCYWNFELFTEPFTDDWRSFRKIRNTIRQMRFRKYIEVGNSSNAKFLLYFIQCYC